MPPLLKPVTTKFSFHIPGVRARFSVVEFSATEYISLPFVVEMILTSKEEVSFEEVLNRPALLTVSRARSFRYFHAVVDRFVYTEKNKDERVYQARLVPSVWLLSLKQDCRIFQDKSVPEIVQMLLHENQLSQSLDLRLQRNYPTIEFCAQYQESDFDFISRLLEQEGIFYFFEHSKTKHTLVLADHRSSYQPCQDNASVAYLPDGGDTASQDGITEFQITRNLNSGKVVLKDYNFRFPTKNLPYQAQAGANRNYEIYHYPGRFEDQYGNTLARIRLQEMITFNEVATGSSSQHRFTPGKWFRLTRHEQRSFNRQFLLTAITHNGYQRSNTKLVDDESRLPGYFNDFVAVPASVTFTPARRTPQPQIRGPQTAIVTGPAGKEIYTDNYGRVKVQFHWDRVGNRDEHSSGWVRVSQIWAGADYGAIFLPRVGEEVIVDFLNGDLRRPVIVGRLYNGEKTPPYSLPGKQTISTIKSATINGVDGSNELRFEDKKGVEEIFVHAEKDLTITVENAKAETIGTSELTNVGLNRTTKVGKDLNETIAGHQRISVGIGHSEIIGADKQVSVGGNVRVSVGNDMTETIGGRMRVSAGKDCTNSIGGNLTETVSKSSRLNAAKIILTAKDEIVLKTGKASITLKKNGDMSIIGKSIDIKGSGNVVIKGKKVLSN